eukprot:5124502-Amphidinium_carterae.1
MCLSCVAQVYKFDWAAARVLGTETIRTKFLKQPSQGERFAMNQTTKCASSTWRDVKWLLVELATRFELGTMFELVLRVCLHQD